MISPFICLRGLFYTLKFLKFRPDDPGGSTVLLFDQSITVEAPPINQSITVEAPSIDQSMTVEAPSIDQSMTVEAPSGYHWNQQSNTSRGFYS
jgi:hypothetical protein